MYCRCRNLNCQTVEYKYREKILVASNGSRHSSARERRGRAEVGGRGIGAGGLAVGRCLFNHLRKHYGY